MFTIVCVSEGRVVPRSLNSSAKVGTTNIIITASTIIATDITTAG